MPSIDTLRDHVRSFGENDRADLLNDFITRYPDEVEHWLNYQAARATRGPGLDQIIPAGHLAAATDSWQREARHELDMLGWIPRPDLARHEETLRRTTSKLLTLYREGHDVDTLLEQTAALHREAARHLVLDTEPAATDFAAGIDKLRQQAAGETVDDDAVIPTDCYIGLYPPAQLAAELIYAPRRRRRPTLGWDIIDEVPPAIEAAINPEALQALATGTPADFGHYWHADQLLRPAAAPTGPIWDHHAWLALVGHVIRMLLSAGTPTSRKHALAHLAYAHSVDPYGAKQLSDTLSKERRNSPALCAAFVEATTP